MTDRDRILERTNGGFDVFVRYMGDRCRKKMFCNPLRSTDDHPSCHLYYRESRHGGMGRFFLKDFGDSSWCGDCFWLVATIEGLDLTHDFGEILRVIDRECGLYILGDAPAGWQPAVRETYPLERKDDNRPVLFTPKYRHFNRYELDFWDSYGISREVLERYHVRCLSECRFERPDGSGYTIRGTRDIPLFGYTFNGGTGIKTYRPGATVRFLYAGNLPKPYIFGLDQLSDGTGILYVTGGEKDVLSLASRGFAAICLNSETAKLPRQFLDSFLERYQHIIFLYDSDEVGRKESALRVLECGSPARVSRIVLPLAGTKEEKDVSDYFRKGFTRNDLLSLTEEALRQCRESEPLNMSRS